MQRGSSQKILQQFKNDILAGKFDHSAFLPSERDLAVLYGTGRGVVRGVIRELAEDGLLSIIPSRGVRLKGSAGKPRFSRILLHLENPSVLTASEKSGLVSGICEAASSLYAEVVLSCAPVKLDEKVLIERFYAGEIHGLLFLETFEEKLVEDLTAAGVPCVVANLENQSACVHSRMDFRMAGRLAGQRLIQSGYRRIGIYAGPLERFIFREMLAGFRGALAEEDLTVPPEWMVVSEPPDSAPDEIPAERIKNILSAPPSRRPEAFFAMRDIRASLLFRVCRQLNLRIPRDVGILGYDDISWPGAAQELLTTIKQNVRMIGIRAVELLRDWYENGKKPESCTIPGFLIERGSLRKKLSPR